MKVRTILLLSLVFFSACSLVPVEKRLLSQHRGIRFSALNSLRQLSPDRRDRVVDAMIRTLDAPDDRLTHRATDALVTIGAPAVPALLRLLNSKDPFQRVIAASTLGEIGTPVDTVGPALAARLSDPHPLVREEAAHALGKLGPEGTGAVVALTAALKDPQMTVRSAAEDALKSLGVKIKKTG